MIPQAISAGPKLKPHLPEYAAHTLASAPLTPKLSSACRRVKILKRERKGDSLTDVRVELAR